MHEMGVTRSLVDTVVAEAERMGAMEVKTVFLRIGFARDIVDELLDGCFKWMARGTLLEGAELIIERVPFTVRCNKCGLVYHIDLHDEETWPCPHCHERDYRLNTGMEFQIAGIEARFGDTMCPEDGSEAEALPRSAEPSSLPGGAGTGRRPACKSTNRYRYA